MLSFLRIVLLVASHASIVPRRSLWRLELEVVMTPLLLRSTASDVDQAYHPSGMMAVSYYQNLFLTSQSLLLYGADYLALPS